MKGARRVAVHFEPDVHRALKLKAACSDRSVSEMVNDAVRVALADDADRYRVRQGAYRIVYEVPDEKLVVVLVTIEHPRDVYKNLQPSKARVERRRPAPSNAIALAHEVPC